MSSSPLNESRVATKYFNRVWNNRNHDFIIYVTKNDPNAIILFYENVQLKVGIGCEIYDFYRFEWTCRSFDTSSFLDWTHMMDAASLSISCITDPLWVITCCYSFVYSYLQLSFKIYDFLPKQITLPNVELTRSFRDQPRRGKAPINHISLRCHRARFLPG